MKIYVAHSSNFDYINKIYNPVKNDSELRKHEIVLPHENENNNNSRDYYNSFDLAICEVSYPSVGLGIEMGFFYDSKVPIYCLYEKGTNYSKSIEVVSNNIIEYDGINDFILKIKEIIKSR